IMEGRSSFGKKHNKTHTFCQKCGQRAFHIQKKTCALNWSNTTQQGKRAGTGRMNRTVPKAKKNTVVAPASSV
ncbi:unnamed protein product, partial [Candidula unifasciata]